MGEILADAMALFEHFPQRRRDHGGLGVVSELAADAPHQIGDSLVALVAMWKALPAKHRAAIELRYPRPVGLVRTLVALLPDLIGAARVQMGGVGHGRER